MMDVREKLKALTPRTPQVEEMCQIIDEELTNWLTINMDFRTIDEIETNVDDQIEPYNTTIRTFNNHVENNDE